MTIYDNTKCYLGFTMGIPPGTGDRPVPAVQVQVWSWVPSLVPIPVPAAGIPVGNEQGGRAKVRATQAMAQCT